MPTGHCLIIVWNSKKCKAFQNGVSVTTRWKNLVTRGFCVAMGVLACARALRAFVAGQKFPKENNNPAVYIVSTRVSKVFAELLCLAVPQSAILR